MQLRLFGYDYPHNVCVHPVISDSVVFQELSVLLQVTGIWKSLSGEL